VLYLEPSFLWTLLKIDHKYTESFEMRCWWRENMCWNDRVKNEEVLRTYVQGGKEYPTYNNKKKV
jgi:hypothetical protein